MGLHSSGYGKRAANLLESLEYNAHFCSSQTEVFYFCRDGRILPALGQQSFVMIDLEQPNKMRLFNVEESIKDALKTVVIKTQPHLAHITESEEFTEFKWNCPVWNHTLDENEPKVLKKEFDIMSLV